MSKSVHITLSNYSESVLTQTAAEVANGTWTDGFAPPQTIDAGTAVEWKTEADHGSASGSTTFSIGSVDAQVTISWRSDGGGTFDFDLSSGWELLGTTVEGDDTQIDLRFAPTTPHVVDGFAPSTHGFAFANDFPEDMAVRTIDLGVVKIPIGKASNGLCGGMTFAARDYLQSGIPMPTQTDPPVGDGNVLFEYLATRLIDSFDLPHLPTTLLTIMNPAYPDHDGGIRNSLAGADGRARLMARKEFAKIREAIDSGMPCPICIVKAKSASPSALGQNHQILVYGYQVDGTQLTLWAYDPNNPGRDDAGILLDIGHTDRDIAVSVSIADLDPIYCFVVTNYQPTNPPDLTPSS